MPRKKGRTSVGYSVEERPRASGKPHWRVRIWVDDPATGKSKLQIVGTYPTKTEAQREGAKAVEQRERGTLLQPTDMTVGELLDLWLSQEVPKTVSAIESLYGKLSDAGYSSSLVRKCHLYLSSALKLATRRGWINTNPCEAVTAPRLTHKEPTVWTPAETGKFLKAAEKDHMNPYWALACETGARTSELLGLGWSDLDVERGTVTIGRRAVRLLKGTPIIKAGAKTDAGRRTIRLTESMVKALQSHRTRQSKTQRGTKNWTDHDLIFCTASGLPVNPSHIRKAFDRLIAQAGVKRLTPHGMRKSHITALIAAGANPKSVAQRVGHRDINTTLKTYTALTTSMQDELHQMVEALATLQGKEAPETSAAD